MSLTQGFLYDTSPKVVMLSQSYHIMSMIHSNVKGFDKNLAEVSDKGNQYSQQMEDWVTICCLRPGRAKSLPLLCLGVHHMNVGFCSANEKYWNSQALVHVWFPHYNFVIHNIIFNYLWMTLDKFLLHHRLILKLELPSCLHTHVSQRIS